uniref:Uridine kinase n=1 Tax=Romanomermis culicivorax TaxID=13658 RepID=A0A915HKN8_ROMCU
MEPFCVGICGGSGCGKTSLADQLISLLDIPWVNLLRFDCFYKSLSDEQCALADKNEYDFDHPNAIDFDLALSTIQRLKEGKKVDVPVYDYKTHKRTCNVQAMYGAAVLIVEGILIFFRQEIRDLLDLKIFLDTDADIRLARRLLRDSTQRERSVKSILDQYTKYVKPAFQTFIAPFMMYADVIIPRGIFNTVAIDILIKHIRVRLRERQGMHTIIRNRETDADEFIFYSNRIARLIIEKALSLQNFTPHEIRDNSFVYSGKKRTGQKICGVSILRSGEVIEKLLRDVVKNCTIGKILIQTDWKESHEPQLHYLRIPNDIHEYKVILMDAQVATGAAAMMGIRILLEHDVPEGNITLVSLLMSAVGVNSIAYAFPQVKLVTSAIDPELSSSYDILPGIGNFSDRYFGTY